MRETLSQLPFVHKVHNITYRDEIYENILTHLAFLANAPTSLHSQILGTVIPSLKSVGSPGG
jgi:hypothetical protein